MPKTTRLDWVMFILGAVFSVMIIVVLEQRDVIGRILSACMCFSYGAWFSGLCHGELWNSLRNCYRADEYQTMVDLEDELRK